MEEEEEVDKNTNRRWKKKSIISITNIYEQEIKGNKETTTT